MRLTTARIDLIFFPLLMRSTTARIDLIFPLFILLTAEQAGNPKADVLPLMQATGAAMQAVIEEKMRLFRP